MYVHEGVAVLVVKDTHSFGVHSMARWVVERQDETYADRVAQKHDANDQRDGKEERKHCQMQGTAVDHMLSQLTVGVPVTRMKSRVRQTQCYLC